MTNYQNIDGIERLYNRAIKAHKILPVDRGKLIVIPVPSRDETYSEYDKSEEWKNIYASRFAHLYSNWLPKEITPREAINKLVIPYVTKWSFGENLPVLENKYELQIPTSLSAAYNRLSQLIYENLDWYKTMSLSDPFDYKNSKYDIIRTREELESLSFELKKVRSERTLLLIMSALVISASVIFYLMFIEPKFRIVDIASANHAWNKEDSSTKDFYSELTTSHSIPKSISNDNVPDSILKITNSRKQSILGNNKKIEAKLFAFLERCQLNDSLPNNYYIIKNEIFGKNNNGLCIKFQYSSTQNIDFLDLCYSLVRTSNTLKIKRVRIIDRNEDFVTIIEVELEQL